MKPALPCTRLVGNHYKQQKNLPLVNVAHIPHTVFHHMRQKIHAGQTLNINPFHTYQENTTKNKKREITYHRIVHPPVRIHSSHFLESNSHLISR